ncbi:hypothetical protein C3B58_20995 [Lactonifactor longoviformis]|uniref:Uncharacterized protein n=1 Tax=Lactonifactor longoviformis DSM 17459 TaxID=1122155 RepID=A0A1M5CM62_9CLOT|nr:hypothetical protein [Lactonifactor longoviformis]POP30494.1 hypothetical protein C3B58_20995 [Lactonifactor longoviformis]SHF55512.1 hypothetical protein SAMN02745158_04200 [Lactonifactor longoviformis DSM 17459]
MTGRRSLYILLAVVLSCLSIAGCGNKEVLGNPNAELKLSLGDTEGWKEERDTPHSLAIASVELYQQMMDGRVTPEEGWEQLRQMGCRESVEAMNAQKTEFIQSIEDTKEYFNSQQEAIEGYDFSECVEDSNYENRKVIYRIQNMKSGKKYYFRQDFVQEDGKWRIYGDNVENEFALEES